jgi:hypothetical protein
MQMGKSTFSAQRKFDEDENIEVESTSNQAKVSQLNQIPLVTQAVQNPEQPSAN